MAGFYPVKHWMVGYNLMLWDVINSKYGGGRGIRTPEDLAALTDFKSVGFNHSPIPPSLIILYNIQELLKSEFFICGVFQNNYSLITSVLLVILNLIRDTDSTSC